MNLVRRIRRYLIRLFERALAAFMSHLPEEVLVALWGSIDLRQRLDYERAEIFLVVESRVELATRLHSCAKEPETVSWIEGFRGPDVVFYDIGANVGAYSLVAAKCHEGAIRVYAFEPAFATYAALCRNILINGSGEEIFPIQLALSGETGPAVFHYSSLESGAALHSMVPGLAAQQASEKPHQQIEPGNSAHQILSCSLDELIGWFGLPFPDYVKIDVDGAELEVLEGARNVLSNDSLRELLVEVDEATGQQDKLVNLLGVYGFHLRSKHRYRYAEEEGVFLGVHNYVFVRPDRGRT